MSNNNNEGISLYKHWRAYNAILIHFDRPSYDCFECGFRMPTLTVDHYRKKWANTPFMSLFKTPQLLCTTEWDMVEYYFANIVFGEKRSIRDMNRKYWKEYVKRIESFSYLYTKDIIDLSSLGDLNTLLRAKNGELPPVISEVLADTIHYETVVALEMITGFSQHVESHIDGKHSFWWPSFAHRLRKCVPFVRRRISQEKIRKMTLECFT